MLKELKPAVLIFIMLTVITGIFYPLAVTGIAQLFWHEQANGSLLYRSGGSIGSKLIGQQFDEPKYFWGRLSATSGVPYNGAASSGSNFGPMNPALGEVIRFRIKALKTADTANTQPVPIDLVTASASGLDPHISIASANYQIPRIARVRGLTEDSIRIMVQKHTRDRLLGIIGEPVVNVLELNLELDSQQIVGIKSL